MKGRVPCSQPVTAGGAKEQKNGTTCPVCAADRLADCRAPTDFGNTGVAESGPPTRPSRARPRPLLDLPPAPGVEIHRASPIASRVLGHVETIRESFEASRKRYGSPRVW